MALQDDCILWNKLGSNAEVTNSEIGSNFAIGGAPDYAAAKFGNGIRIDANSEVVSIANTPAQHDFAKGAIEMWVKLPYNVVNGIPDDGNHHGIFSWFKDANNQCELLFHNALGLYNEFHDGGNKDWWTNDAGLDIFANTLTHIIFAWDRTHATKKRRFYINGVEIVSNNTAFNDIDMTTASFVMGLYHASALSFGGIIDNIKWYNNCTDATIAAIDANKDNEGWPVSGGGRLIDNKMISPLIDGGVMIG